MLAVTMTMTEALHTYLHATEAPPVDMPPKATAIYIARHSPTHRLLSRRLK